MEKTLKMLPDLINVSSIEELSTIIKNPDSFTIRVMSLKSNEKVENAFNSFRENDEIKELLAELNYNGTVADLVDALKESDKGEVLHVASFIEEKLSNLENINLEGKSLASVIWSTVIYNYILDDHNHIGITDIDDIYELLPVSFIQCMSDGDIDAPAVTIEKLKEEVLSIFENTELNNQIKGYFATAFIKNRVWGNSRDNSWYDYEKLAPIATSTKTIKIESDEELISVLQTPTASNYQKAVEYVAEKYFTNSKNDFNAEPNDLKNYKAHLVVGLLASSVIEEEKIADFRNVAFNICAKIIANKEKLETSISRSNIGIKLSKAYENTLLGITEDAERVAYDMLMQKIVIDEDEVDEVAPQEMPLEEKSAIIVGSKKQYVKGYLNLFSTLINAKLGYYEDQLKTLKDISERKSYSFDKELTVNDLAKECNAEVDLYTNEEQPNNNARLHYNASMVYTAVKRQHALMSQINGVFTKVRKKTKDSLDIQNLAFDYKLLQKTSFIVEEQHEKVIKEFYSFLASDPILKSSLHQYRLAPRTFLMENLKDRAKKTPTNFPAVSEMLSLVKSPKNIEVKRTVDKLYINTDGSVNDKYETLYNAITNKESSIEEKRIALDEATEKGIVTKEQQQVIAKHINDLEIKWKKKMAKEEKTDAVQLEFDIDSESEKV